MAQQNKSEIVELPEEIKNEVIKDLEGKVFDREEEYTVHVLTPRERARLCLKIKPGVKFAAHVKDNEKLMDYHGIPRYILLEKKLTIMAQQTAVEWFWIHLPENISKEYFDLFKQAKQMETEQIIEAYRVGVEEDVYNNPLKTGQEYYNETYITNK